MAIGRLTQLATAITPTSGLSITAALPSDGSVTAGDVLLALCAMPSGSRTFSITGGTGTWTSLGSAAVPGHTSQLWWKICSSDDPGASITVTHTGGTGGMRQLLALGKISGVDSVTPFGSPSAAVGEATGTQSTTKTSLPLSGVAATSRELGVAVDTRAGTLPNTTAWTPPAGFTTTGALYTTESTGLSLVWGDADTTGSGSMGSRTWTADQPAYGSAWALAALEGASDIPATLVRQTVGAPTETGFTVAAKVSDTASVRLAVATNSALTGATYHGPATPDADGYVQLTATGLTAGTDHWYELELDGELSGRAGQCRTLPAAGPPHSFGFAVGSCALTGSEHTVFDAIRTRIGADGRPAAFFAHIGDLQYRNGGGAIAPATETALTADAEAALASERQRQLYETIPVSYTWSDVDFGGSNSDSTWSGNSTQQTVYRKLWPHPTLPAEGIYRSWVIGRIRFIQTDSRSFMSAKAAADNADKTMLGAVQKTWLKQQLIADEPVKIWLHDNAWLGSPSNPGNDERWRAYNTERTEIAAYIAANADQVGQLHYVHGDTHTLAADDGTNNDWGGFPVYCIAPLDQTASPWDLATMTAGTYPDSAVTARQYGWFDITDTGSQITVAFTGYDADGTARITQTTVTDTQEIPMPRVAVPITQATRAGTVLPTPATGDPTNNHTVANDGRVILMVNNTGAGAHDITFHTARSIDGLTAPARVESVPAAETQLFGPFDAGDYGTTLDVDVASAELVITAIRV